MTLHPLTQRYVRRQDRDGVGEPSDGDHWFAGGTDLIPLARTGVVDAEELVDIKSGDLDGTIERTKTGWRLGALATLSDLGDHVDLGEAVPAIREAVSQSATLQIRNRATIGGNLLQRPRCSYFRDPEIACWMKGGTECPAREGRNEHHALIDEPCVTPQPSDLASVLVAVDAEVTIAGAGDRHRTIPVSEFLQRPTAERRRLHTLATGELITSIDIADVTNRRSTYLKAMDRATWQFALVGIAAAVDTDETGVVTKASLVATGIDSIPHRLTHSADELAGSTLSTESITAAVRCATDGLVPLPENGYKLALLRGLIQRSLEHVQQTPDQSDRRRG